MINTARRDAILIILSDWLEVVMELPPGPERAQKVQELGQVISGLNSAQTDRAMGRALLDWYGVK